MKNNAPNLQYRSYLLRMWEERDQTDEGLTEWRFSLEHVRSKTRCGFTCLADMLIFLEREIVHLEKTLEKVEANKKGANHG